MDWQDGVEKVKRFLLLLLLLSCTVVPKVVFDNGVKFDVELAQTSAEKAKGLMYRSSMPENHGMLFIFDAVAPRSFWMKNTLIPLDMIFIDSEMKVVEIKSNVLPCEADPCPTYTSLPAMYVLEINAGLSEKSGIKIGSLMSRE